MQRFAGMDELERDIQKRADEVAKLACSQGYRADFSPSSVWELEMLLKEHSSEGEPVENGLLAVETSDRLLGLGLYFGEVLRQTLGGQWVADRVEPESRVGLELHLPDGTVCTPVRLVLLAYVDGTVGSFAMVAERFGLEVGDQPNPIASDDLPKCCWCGVALSDVEQSEFRQTLAQWTRGEANASPDGVPEIGEPLETCTVCRDSIEQNTEELELQRMGVSFARPTRYSYVREYWIWLLTIVGVIVVEVLDWLSK